MGYQIRYGDPTNKFIINKDNKNRKHIGLFAGLICLVIFATIALAANGYLVPGDASVTKTAVKTFKQEMKDADDIGKAFTAFCKEIVAGAQLS